VPMTSKVNQRIFRSIVVAGAMLGTPLVAVADGKPGVTDAQPALEKLEAQKQLLVAKVAQAVTAVEKADNDRDRSLAKEALAQLQREHASIESQIATERARRNVKYGTIGHGHGTGVGVGIGGSTPLSSFELIKLEKQRIELVKEVPPLLASIQEAKDDKARVAAKARLDAKKAEIAGLDTKIATEKQRLARVRGGTARPKGRGFVLA